MNLPENFRIFLISQKSSPATIKNYLADVNNFFNWLAQTTGIRYQVAGPGIFSLFTKETITEYQQYLLTASAPPSTINRRLSALRKLEAFAKQSGWLVSNPTAKIPNLDIQKPVNRTQILEKTLSDFRQNLKKSKASPLTVKNYLSDVRHFLNWRKNNPQQDTNQYQNDLAQSFSLATSKRHASSIRQFLAWVGQQDRLTPKKLAFQPTAKNRLPTFWKIGLGTTLVVLMTFAAARFFNPEIRGLLNQLSRGQASSPVIATAYSPWIIAFKGRLEDELTQAKIVFRLYEKASGGEFLWQSKTWELEADSQGEFQAPLGDVSQGDFDLPSQLFFQKEKLFLGISVNDQPENSPRIPISTAGYTAGSDMVPVLTKKGFLVLAAASPKIMATQGTFSIEGQAISLITPPGSDGNITLAPDGSGVLNLILSSPTGQVVSAQDANLGASGKQADNSLIFGSVANDSVNYNLLKLESGSTPTNKFSVDAGGNTSIAGNLHIGSGIIQSHDANHRVILDAVNNLFEIREYGDIVLSAGVATGSATNTLFLDNSGKIGIGTTSPAAGLDIGGGNAQLASDTNDALIKGDLEVDGKLRVDGSQITTSNSLAWDLTNNSTTALNFESGLLNLDTKNSRVGIGTTAPAYTFDISGSASISSNLYIGQSLTVQGTTLATTGNIETSGNLTVEGNTILGNEATDTTKIQGISSLGDGGTTNYAQFTATGDLAFYGNADTISGGSTITINPTGNLYLQDTSYSFSETGDFALGGRITFENNAYIQNETDGILYFNEPTLQFAASTALDIDSPSLNLSTQAVAIDLANTQTQALNIESGLLNLDTANSRIGIGTTAPTVELDVTGSLAVSGSTTLGSDTSNRLTINAWLNSDLIPYTGSEYDLGSNTRPWQTGYFDAVHTGSIEGTLTSGSTTASDWLINSDNTTEDTQDATLTFERGSPAVNAEIRWDSTNKYLSTNAPGLVIAPDAAITASGKAALIVNQIQEQDIFTASASGVPKFVINNAGNVGIGTTAPTSKLHVAGQCVTGDSLLAIATVNSEQSRLRRGFGGQATVNSQKIEYTQIKDIKGGEYVLSLDETTGKLVPARIKGLLDMGVQPVYKLTTEDGRTIRTTGNHPYLTQDGWKKVVYLNKGEEIAVVGKNLTSSRLASPRSFGGNGIKNQDQKKSNYRQPEGDLDISINSRKFAHNSPFFSNQLARNNDTIAKKISPVKTSLLGNSDKSEKLGRITTAPAQPAARFVKNPEKTLAQDWLNNFIENNNTSKNSLLSNEDIGWERIVSIEYVGQEQVYDIEVEGTHNFIAGHILRQMDNGEWRMDKEAEKALTENNSQFSILNSQFRFGGIIAHNTYITGAQTGQALAIFDETGDQNILVASASGTTKFTLDRSGNITLAAGADIRPISDSTTALNIANAAGTDFVTFDTTNSRVGIGTTGPAYKLDVAGSFHATQTITSYDNVITVDRNGGGDYTTIGAAITAINNAGDASSTNPYVIWVMAGTYDEDATLPNYVSIKGQGFYSTIIDGRLTIGSGSHVEDLRIFPSGSETTALIANPTVASSYITNTYIVIYNNLDASTFVIKFTGSTDLRIYNSFLYNQNAYNSASAKNYIIKHEGTSNSGDVEIQNTHTKSSCPNNNNCILAWNASTGTNSDIIITGCSWSAFHGTTAPVGAINDNTNGGQIKLGVSYENDQLDYTMYTTSGNNIVIAPTNTGNIVSSLGNGFTSGNGFTMNFPVATTLAGTLTGIDLDLSTSVTDGNYQVKGLNLTIPDSGTTTSYGLYVSGEDANYFSGNLGIGTTSPTSKLHVAGQCVTGDTLLPLVAEIENGKWIMDKYFPIKDIKGGEYVLSLNEETGKIIPARIKGLLDMGVQSVYKLTTEDGRTIRTTGNHPYLTANGWKKVVYLSENEEIAVAKEDLLARLGNSRRGRLVKGNPSQEKNNQHQGSENQNIGVNSPKIAHFSNSSSNLTVNNKNIIPTTILNVKTKNSSSLLGADRLEPMNAAEETSDVKWSKIQSIEYVGNEQVYDIEVEGTHNFVANGIIAHNTYITGAQTGQALTILDETGDQNILVASASGVNKMTLDRSGNLTLAGTISGATWNGTAIGAIYGGTGQTTVTTGDLLYGSAGNTWGKLADVATGNVLLSGGVETAPSWGKVALGTHTTGNYVSTLNSLTGTLTIAGGGINTVSADGSTITVTGTEADTLASVTGRGASTATAVTISATGNALTLSGAGANLDFSGAGLAQITSAASQNLALMPGGNVGIGTTNPISFKLEIAGNVGPDANPGVNTITTTETLNNSAQLAMALTATDLALVAYYDGTDLDLEYYICGNNDCSSRTVTTLASTNNVGAAPAIALNSNGYAQITHFDNSSYDLEFVNCTNTDCSANNQTTIDTDIAGWVSDIRIAPSDDLPRMVYHWDSTAEGIKYVQCTNASCSTKVTSTVVSGYHGYCGIGCGNSLALDANNYGMIAYTTGNTSTGGNLVFIQCTNAGCSTKNTNTVDSSSTFSWSDIELGSDGFPRIAYYNTAGYSLKFARCTDSACSASIITTVDSGNVGQYCSIALDSNNYAYISYYDAANGNLKMVRCTNNDCSQKTILTMDSTNDTGKGTGKSLKLASDGKVRITYFEDTNDYFKYLIEGSSGRSLGSSATYWDQVNAKYFITRGTGDVAEIYQGIDAGLEPGDIVSVASESAQTKTLVVKTDLSNASALLGVVSASPGLLLAGEKEFLENSLAVALVGQVPVKISAENGPIATGNPITISSIPGVGAKAIQAGPIIGKALEKWDGPGEGKILVALSLGWYEPKINLADKISALLVETKEVKTAVISPLSENGNLAIKLADLPDLPTKSQFQIINSQDKVVASIDSAGNAFFAGDATISGTLYANKIIADEIETASESGILSEEEIQAMVDEILNTPIEATTTAKLSNSQIGELRITNNLTALGNTSLADTSVAGTLNIGGTLSLADGSINTLTGPLYLQNLGLGGVDILAGKIVIDQQGNATFEGDITIKGKLAVNTIAPLPEAESGFGKLLVQGSTNISGDLVASGSGTFQKIIIANNSEQSTVNSEQSTEIQTNATAGEAVLPANETEITILSPFVTEKTLVYITPTSDTQNKVVYVKTKKTTPDPGSGGTDDPGSSMGWFKVGLDKPIDIDIKFNWWIIN